MDFISFTQMYTSCCAANDLIKDDSTECKHDSERYDKPDVDETVPLNSLLENSASCRRKMKLWEETQGTCIYCGKPILARDFVTGTKSDIEHIIPKALGEYSVLDNLACSCRTCNREKGDLTAIDYMLSKDSESLQHFMHRIRLMAIGGLISKEKYYNLLQPKHLKISDSDY